MGGVRIENLSQVLIHRPKSSSTVAEGLSMANEVSAATRTVRR